MSYEMYRQQFEGESFNDVLVEQLSRTPWLLISAAVHAVVVIVLMLFMGGPEDDPEPEQAKMEMEEEIPEEEEIIEEEPPEDEPEPEELVEDPVEVDEEVDDHDEDDTNEDYEETVGEEDFISDKMDSKSNNDAIGLGGGAGGSFGGRRGGRKRARRGRGRKAQAAVDRGLEWLALHQSPDGRWDSDGFMGNGDSQKGPLADGKGAPQWDVGVTGLALLCFLGAGETHRNGQYKKTVAKGLKWLRDQQGGEGCFGSKTVANFTYNHAIGALAMAEAFSLTKSPLFKSCAEKGIAYVQQCQNPYKAWRYKEADGQNDTSVTGWMVMALKSAKTAHISLDERRFGWALDWIVEMTDEESGRTGYIRAGEPPVREPNKKDEFPGEESESLTAVGICCRVFCGQDPAQERMIKLGVDNLLSKKLPVWDQAKGSIDMYYWYYGTLAMFQVGGESWKSWNEAMNEAIIERQRADGNFSGSWDPKGAWGETGGRVYSTALMTLCLEVYYRYGRVFGTGK